MSTISRSDQIGRRKKNKVNRIKIDSNRFPSLFLQLRLQSMNKYAIGKLKSKQL